MFSTNGTEAINRVHCVPITEKEIGSGGYIRIIRESRVCLCVERINPRIRTKLYFSYIYNVYDETGTNFPSRGSHYFSTPPLARRDRETRLIWTGGFTSHLCARFYRLMRSLPRLWDLFCSYIAYYIVFFVSG